MGTVDWAGGVTNGQIPANLMVDVQDGMLLNPAAAAAYHEWAADYKSVSGVTLTISEAYRNYDKQVYYWNLYRSGAGNVAAVPGTSSHGQGLAVDVNSWTYGGSANTTEHQQLVDSGHRHNWSWELVGKPSGEAWHFNFVGDPTATPAAPPKPQSEDGEGNMAFSPEAQAEIDGLKTQLNQLGVGIQLLIGLPANQQGFIAQIQAEYQSALGRDADAGGLTMFLGLMVNQHWTIGQVHDAIVSSNEYKTRLVQSQAYQAILGRDGSPAELQGWVNWLNAGHSIDDLIAAFKGSDEYKNKH